jgi:hypothetical protein
MKIEVIRKESKPVDVELHVGGVYRQTLGDNTFHYVLTKASDGYRLVCLNDGETDEEASTEDEIKSTIKTCDLVYVPNARLVIDEG